MNEKTVEQLLNDAANKAAWAPLDDGPWDLETFLSVAELCFKQAVGVQKEATS